MPSLLATIAIILKKLSYLDIEGPISEQMFQLYGVFVKDMVNYPIFIGKKQIGFKRSKSSHPLFKGKLEGFVHICTRENSLLGIRNFDSERTNKIHWIKPVIYNQEDNRIKYFERLHFKGQNQIYFWFQNKSYVVIIREITTNLKLVTAFKVDKTEENRFLNWYRDYKKAGLSH